MANRLMQLWGVQGLVLVFRTLTAITAGKQLFTHRLARSLTPGCYPEQLSATLNQNNRQLSRQLKGELTKEVTMPQGLLATL
jgi:hypothetical protein